MKTIEEIYQEMLAVFDQETGMALSGAGEQAVRMYALAAQLYGLYQEAEWVRKQCFPQTAVGEDRLPPGAFQTGGLQSRGDPAVFRKRRRGQGYPHPRRDGVRDGGACGL